MNQYFEIGFSFNIVDEKQHSKRVRGRVVLTAETFTEAEACIIAWFNGNAKDGASDLSVDAIKRVKVTDVVFLTNHQDEDNSWYWVTLSYVNFDDKSLNRVDTHLVYAESAKSVSKYIEQEINNETDCVVYDKRTIRSVREMKYDAVLDEQ